MALLAGAIRLKPLRPQVDHLRALAEAILSQQISDKAADSIIARVKALFPGKLFPSAEDILKIRAAKLNKAGVSRQKISYLKDLARHVKEKKIDFEAIGRQSDEEVIAELVAVKGIGRWTAEMFLIFSLGRPDIFSAGDLGLRNAVKRLYGLKKDPSTKRLLSISKAWTPYRSLASRYLWASLKG